MAKTLDPRTVAPDATTISLAQDVRRHLHHPAATPKWPAGVAMDDEQLTVAGVLIAAWPSEKCTVRIIPQRATI